MATDGGLTRTLIGAHGSDNGMAIDVNQTIRMQPADEEVRMKAGCSADAATGSNASHGPRPCRRHAHAERRGGSLLRA